MTASELMASYCVVVNKGSGVLVNAMSQDYSYVLTARHVLTEANAKLVVTDVQGRELKVLSVLNHTDQSHSDTYDCAVIQVEYIPTVAQQSFPASSLPDMAPLKLVGFPGTERGSTDPMKVQDGHMTSVRDHLIVFTVSGTPGKDAIEGMSGGGIYHVANERPYLVGVEFGMDSINKHQQYGRVQCQGLVRFEEIIEANNKAPIIPAYLECFSRLREQIFSFNVINKNTIIGLKTELLNFADSLVAQGIPPPFELMTKYKDDLIIGPFQPADIKDKRLWVAYFEFLIICAILDNVSATDYRYIKELERRRRILYTNDGSNWVGKLDIILKAARKFLDKDGTVIVASPEQGADLLPDGFEVDRVIQNIALVPGAGPLAPIDQVERAMYKSFVLTHLEGLRKQCVVRNERLFANTEPGIAQLRAFKEYFNAFIK
ncbi:TPA: trypsin-like peptidase domain-containing protein [Yersinia enterocolitica]|uniref:Serine protease n=1 Tax=Yersinia rochesterensis TaxID=1604335 RepID=A0A8D4MZQ2_9GAMM|nr:ABC-three component system protein [Yersinia rochesterensis]AYD42786.1 serine protease [Yersinia rochesterensis]HDL8300620.1 trypsin-like peptidase domain-containing protein [Yersinia enterocolitica]HDW9410482.1 trypsin-like peptidase domain-containing protein [Yersinia enterocolitica]